MKKFKKHRKQESLSLKDDVAKYLLDLSKLVFAGIVLGTVLRYEFPREILRTVDRWNYRSYTFAHSRFNNSWNKKGQSPSNEAEDAKGKKNGNQAAKKE